MSNERTANVNLPIEHRCIGVGSFDCHRLQNGPLVRFGRIAFRRSQPFATVMAAHRIDFAIQRNDTHITSFAVHRGNFAPLLCDRIEDSARVEMLGPLENKESGDCLFVMTAIAWKSYLESTDAIDLMPDHRRTMVRPWPTGVLVANLNPAIGPCIVRFDQCSWFALEPPADGEYDFMR